MTASSLQTLNRRASISALGGLAAARLVILEAPSAAGKSSARKKSRQRCKKDTTACIATLLTRCAQNTDAESCVAALTPCCETCSANGFLVCFLNTPQVMK